MNVLQTLCYVALYLALTLMMMYQNFDQRIALSELGRKTVAQLVPLTKTITFFILMTVACTRIKKEVSYREREGN